MTDHSPSDETDISKLFSDALSNDVRRIMSGQVRALSAANANLLILLVNLSSLLVSKGVLTKDEIDNVVKPHIAAQPGDMTELVKIRETMLRQYLSGVEIVSKSLSTKDADNG